MIDSAHQIAEEQLEEAGLSGGGGGAPIAATEDAEGVTLTLDEGSKIGRASNHRSEGSPMNTQTNTLPAITLDGRTSLGVIYASDFTTSTTDVLRDRWTEGKMKAVVDALDGRPVVIELGGGSGFALAGTLEGVVKAWPGRGPRVTVATLNGTRTNYRLDDVGMILEVAESITGGGVK